MSDSTVLQLRRRRQPRPQVVLLKPQQAAERMQVSVATVRRYIRDGKIPHIYLGDYPGAPVRIPVAEFEEWLDRRKEGWKP